MTEEYGSKVATVGGCIRFDKDGVYLHENATHKSIGIESIRLNQHYLNVVFTKANPVVSINVSADETISGARGIIAGGSAGGAYVNIAFYDTKIGRRLNLESASDYARIAGPVSNVWFTVTHYIG